MPANAGIVHSDIVLNKIIALTQPLLFCSDAISKRKK